MKAFYSDVDDTLISSKGMTKQMEDFFYYIAKKEDYFIPCSGRPLISMIKSFEKFNLRYLISYNGGQIYDLKNNKILYNQFIAKKEVQKIIEELEKFEVDYLTYDSNIIYTNNLNNEYAQVESEICDEPLTLLEKLNDTPKIIGLKDPKYVDEIIGKLRIKFPEFEIFKSKPFFIEITPKGVTKGEALKKLNNLLKIDDKDTFCFGDSHNDISMFNLGINKLAVSNAVDKIKELADEIILSCDEGGVAKYIKQLYGEKDE